MNENGTEKSDGRSPDKTSDKKKNSKKVSVNSKATKIVFNPPEPSDDSQRMLQNNVNEHSRTVASTSRRKILESIGPKIKRINTRISEKEILEQAMVLKARKRAKQLIQEKVCDIEGVLYSNLSLRDRATIDAEVNRRASPDVLSILAERLISKARVTSIVQKPDALDCIEEISITPKIEESIRRKAEASGVDYEVLKTVFIRGLVEASEGKTRHQNAFDRINSFISNGKARSIDSDLSKKPGAGFIGTNELVATLKKDTPGQSISEATRNRRIGLTASQNAVRLQKIIAKASKGKGPYSPPPANTVSSPSDLNEVFNLDKVNQIHFQDHDEAAKKFAKEYKHGHLPDYLVRKPTDKENARREKFFNDYHEKTVRSGFAGSGTVEYQHKKTGAKFRVNKGANGKGFFGTDHMIHSVKDD